MKDMWIDVNDDTYVTQEVLAIGYQDELVIGYLYYSKDYGSYCCENDNELLTDVHKYILIRDIKNSAGG